MPYHRQPTDGSLTKGVANDLVTVEEAVALQGHILSLQQRLVIPQLQRKLGRGSMGDFDVSPTV